MSPILGDVVMLSSQLTPFMPDLEEGDTGEEEEPMAMEDLVPRQDISGKLDHQLCEMLKDKHWKV